MHLEEQPDPSPKEMENIIKQINNYIHDLELNVKKLSKDVDKEKNLKYEFEEEIIKQRNKVNILRTRIITVRTLIYFVIPDGLRKTNTFYIKVKTQKK